MAHHSQFNANKIETVCQDLLENKHDHYDTGNNSDAVDLLWDSINTEIQEELDMVRESKLHFAEQWMEVISIIRLPTADKFQAIKDKMRAITVNSYKGHDIVKVTKDCH